MNFFGREVEVEKISKQYFVNLKGILPDETIKHHSYSAGIPLDNVLPLLSLLPHTGWEGLCQRELIKHIVLDRVFRVGDMAIPNILDVDLGRRFRLSTYKENNEIWVCVIQLDQASLGIHYPLKVAEHLVPVQTDFVHIPFRPRLVWQNDREMMVYFIPLTHADCYFKFLRTDMNAPYVDPYVGKIQSSVEKAWKETCWM